MSLNIRNIKCLSHVKRVLLSIFFTCLKNFFICNFLINRVLEDLARTLKLFVWQLMHMVRKSQNQGKEITEGMYQELFVLFAKTFNLHIL